MKNISKLYLGDYIKVIDKFSKDYKKIVDLTASDRKQILKDPKYKCCIDLAVVKEMECYPYYERVPYHWVEIKSTADNLKSPYHYAVLYIFPRVGETNHINSGFKIVDFNGKEIKIIASSAKTIFRYDVLCILPKEEAKKYEDAGLKIIDFNDEEVIYEKTIIECVKRLT